MCMKNLFRIFFFSFLAGALISCGSNNQTNNESQSVQAVDPGEVNVYTHRHYDTDKLLFEEFTKQTGIKVNVVSASADELIKKLELEGERSPADLLITVDAGRLYRAKTTDLLQAVESEILSKNIPSGFRDSEGFWYSLTYRARVIVYAKDRVKPEQLSTYEDLTTSKWKKKILVRASENLYNQSLLAGIIATQGKDKAKEWSAGIVKNMAREPKGNDTDQIKAIASNIGDIAIVNTYYVGKLKESSNEEELKAAEAIGVFFPNQNDRGTHINISGAGVTKYAPNKGNAIKLLEFLSDTYAQEIFAKGNYEYPVKPDVEVSDLLKSWGTFKTDNVDFSKLGEFNRDAVLIFDQTGWK
jgi:iron(III) transport system substrate-binding protein